MESVFKRIQAYDDYFVNQDVTIVEGYDFNQMDRVKKNHLYYASKFVNGTDEDVRFFNITKPACKNETKEIDIDTKDINVLAMRRSAMTKAWILRRALKYLIKKEKLGQVFNQFSDKLPIYGSVVAKKTNDKKIFAPVQLRNLKNDPTADNLNQCWSIQELWMTPTDLRKMKGKWNDKVIDMAIEAYQISGKENYVDNFSKNDKRGGSQYIHVREYIDDVKKSEIKGKSEEYVRGRFFIVVPDTSKKDWEKKDGLVLHKDTVTDKYFKECHRDRVEGRWLSPSVVEDLEELQILKNEEMHYMKMALRLSSIILLQTEDKKLARNILTDLENGDILRVRKEIKEVPLNVRNLGEKQQISNEIDKLLRDLANTREVMTGEKMMSGTPFSLGAMLERNAARLFDHIREKLGLFYQEIFEDWVAPALSKELTKKRILEITDREEIKELAVEFAKNKTWDAVKKFILEEGRKPTIEEVQLVEQLLVERFLTQKSVFLDLPEKYIDFEDVEFEFTGERVDKQTKLQTISTLITALGQNPALVDNPLFQEALNLSGFGKLDVTMPVVAPQAPQTAPGSPQATPQAAQAPVKPQPQV